MISARTRPASSLGVSRRTLYVLAVGASVLLVGGSALIGYVGAPANVHGFDWTLASVFGTALGTTLLAIGTGALALSTWSDVRQTHELVNLTRQDQLAREHPVVTVEIRFYEPAQAESTPDGNTWARSSGTLRATVGNAGSGPALDVRIAGSTAGGNTIHEKAVPVVYPGERADIVFTVAVDAGGPPGGIDSNNANGMNLRGDYTDRQRTERYGILWTRPDGSWEESLARQDNWKGALPTAADT